MSAGDIILISTSPNIPKPCQAGSMAKPKLAVMVQVSRVVFPALVLSSGYVQGCVSPVCSFLEKLTATFRG